jgi:hypothetical protein
MFIICVKRSFTQIKKIVSTNRCDTNLIYKKKKQSFFVFIKKIEKKSIEGCILYVCVKRRVSN